MNTIKLLLTGALAAAVVACASDQVFHPLEGGVGYSDTQLQGDRFNVTFAGDSTTSRDQVEQFLLYRAAQLTLANGYDYFVLANKETDRSTQYHTFGFGPRWVGPGWYQPGWRAWWGMDPVLDDVDTIPSDRFNATATIIMMKGVAPSGQASAYDAKQLVDRLGPVVMTATPKA